MTDTPRTAVCFDLDYTLVEYDEPFDEIVRTALAPDFEDVSAAATDEAVEAMLVELGAALDAQAPDPYRRALSAACATAGVDADDDGDDGDDDAADALRERMIEAECGTTSVADPVREALAVLAADDSVVVCVLTNGHDGVQRTKLAHHGLDEHVEHVVTSYDAGGDKESGAPYETVRERVDADEYVMIGDDYASDVEAARAAGFVPIHYEETDGPDFFATLSAML